MYRYRTVISSYRGDPGLLGSIGRTLGRVAGAVVQATPIGRAVSTGIDIVRALRPQGGPTLPSVPSFGPGTTVTTTGGGRVGVSPMGTFGSFPGGCLTKDGRQRRISQRTGKCYKRPTMNVTNPRAARRAITRIKGLRRVLHSIEMSLPKRKAAGGCSCGSKRGRR
jgi:hypothetical protein